MSLFSNYFGQHFAGDQGQHSDGTGEHGAHPSLRGSISEEKEQLFVPKMTVASSKAVNSSYGGITPSSPVLSQPNSDSRGLYRLPHGEAYAKPTTFGAIRVDTNPTLDPNRSIFEDQKDVTKMSLKLIKYIKTYEVDKCSKIISRNLADINFRADNDWTPLHFAVWTGNLKVVNLLVVNKANVNAKARNNLTPLMVACNAGNHPVFTLLLTAGANFMEIDLDGNSCLHYAAQGGNLDLCRELQNLGLALDKTNKRGKLPEDCAKTQDIRAFLQDKRETNDEFFVPIFSYTFDKIKNIFSSNDDLPRANDRLKVWPTDFQVLSLLGRGSFGEVFLARKKDTGIKYAMKVLNKQKVMSKAELTRPKSAQVRHDRAEGAELREQSVHRVPPLRFPDLYQAVSDPRLLFRRRPV